MLALLYQISQTLLILQIHSNCWTMLIMRFTIGADWSRLEQRVSRARDTAVSVNQADDQCPAHCSTGDSDHWSPDTHSPGSSSPGSHSPPLCSWSQVCCWSSSLLHCWDPSHSDRWTGQCPHACTPVSHCSGLRCSHTLPSTSCRHWPDHLPDYSGPGQPCKCSRGEMVWSYIHNPIPCSTGQLWCCSSTPASVLCLHSTFLSWWTLARDTQHPGSSQDTTDQPLLSPPGSCSPHLCWWSRGCHQTSSCCPDCCPSHSSRARPVLTHACTLSCIENCTRIGRIL